MDFHSALDPPIPDCLACFLSACHKQGASGKKELQLRKCNVSTKKKESKFPEGST